VLPQDGLRWLHGVVHKGAPALDCVAPKKTHKESFASNVAREILQTRSGLLEFVP